MPWKRKLSLTLCLQVLKERNRKDTYPYGKERNEKDRQRSSSCLVLHDGKLGKGSSIQWLRRD